MAGDIVEWSSAPTAAQRAQPGTHAGLPGLGAANSQPLADGQSALQPDGAGMLPLLLSDEGPAHDSVSQAAVQVTMNASCRTYPTSRLASRAAPFACTLDGITAGTPCYSHAKIHMRCKLLCCAQALQAEQASRQSQQPRSAASQQDRRARQEPPRVQLPSGFHGVSRGEQAAMLMSVISGALRVCPYGICPRDGDLMIQEASEALQTEVTV